LTDIFCVASSRATIGQRRSVASAARTEIGCVGDAVRRLTVAGVSLRVGDAHVTLERS
jgi:hypothetical protein